MSKDNIVILINFIQTCEANMSSNKKAKEALIAKYGNECFIEKLHLRKEKSRVYKGKKQKAKMQQLTYHHILEKRNGGQATLENGALLTAENHAWFHKQSQQAQSKMNEMFQEYKRQADLGIAVLIPQIGVVQKQKIDVDLQDCIEIETQDYNRAEYKQMMQDIKQKYVDR